MIDIKIIIPTYKRAGSVTTAALVSNAALCVTESEEAEYRENHPDAEIIVHPDDVRGLAAKFQWIYERYPNVCMLEDEIYFISRLYTTSGRVSFRRLTPDEVYEIIQWCGNMAKLCGCYLFGFNKNPTQMVFDPMVPIKLSGFVTGAAFGLLEGSGLRFSPESVGVEDFYISGMNAYKHRKAFLDLRFNFAQKDTFYARGGQAEYRTEETEKEGTLYLRRMFGQAVTLKIAKIGRGQKGGGTKFYSHNKYARTMTIPF